MCGIAGYLGPRAESAGSARAVIERMTGLLRHRGPDGVGQVHMPPVVLGHTRLSIIDLATGDQPMSNEDDSIWVVFNGEIFNYVELRAELQTAGHRFRTRSDTETIVHAYEQWGDEFVLKLNGQFAIALWDKNRRRLLLARDRVGIRPLFYAREPDGGLIFASEAKSILAVRSERASIDPRGLAEVFTFWSAVGERTVFKGINNLPPGHVLVHESGKVSIRQYWDWTAIGKSEPAPCSFDAAVEQLRELLRDAVRLQLRSDVPVGAYLSGGLDSSGLVALVRQHSDVQLRTFSIAFSDAEYDESEHQDTVARALDTDHTRIRCTPQDVGAHFPRLIWHTESPILRSAPAPLMMLSKLVRDSGLKVVLTGEGADEVFGGYDLFKEAKIRRFWARQPQSAWRPELLRRMYGYLAHSPVGARAFSKSFFGQQLTDVDNPCYAHLTRWTTTRRLWNFLSDDFRAAIGNWSPEADLQSRLPPTFMQWDDLGRDQYVESHTLLSGYLLSSQGDRVAMANSIEGRVPYLDHRVVEFANRLPGRFKMRALREKAVLREALRPLLPSQITNRVKQPYRAPDSRSFFDVAGKPLDYVSEMFSETRLKSAGYFKPDVATRLFEKCCAGRAIGFADNMAFVGILSTMLLDEQFVRARALV